jgi:histidinol-phosphate aminotransferase
VAALRCLQAPYPIPADVARCALRALAPEALAGTRRTIELVRRERTMLRDALLASPGVQRVYPAQGNFLLVRFADPGAALRRLRDAGVVVRDMRALPELGNALRISIGTRAQNERVLEALRALEAA